MHSTVPTSQSEVTVMRSDDNQPRQDDESSQVEHTNGVYMCDIYKPGASQPSRHAPGLF